MVRHRKPQNRSSINNPTEQEIGEALADIVEAKEHFLDTRVRTWMGDCGRLCKFPETGKEQDATVAPKEPSPACLIVEEEDEAHEGSWSVLGHINQEEGTERSELFVPSADGDRELEWPSLPHQDMIVIGGVGGGQQAEDLDVCDADWDVLSMASSVWTADTTIFGDKKSYSDIVTVGHRPLLNMYPKVKYPPLFTDKSPRGEAKIAKADEMAEEPDICLTSWDGYKNSRGGKVHRWVKGKT